MAAHKARALHLGCVSVWLEQRNAMQLWLCTTSSLAHIHASFHSEAYQLSSLKLALCSCAQVKVMKGQTQDGCWLTDAVTHFECRDSW
jgi:hypothetical protein